MSLFFSFDGIDGVGKSTQLKLFSQWLQEQGRPPVVCRDPGGTALGEQLRAILLDSDAATSIGARSEMFLYMASRAQLVDEVIRPALASGRTVVSDRFLLANVVYQGYGGGVDVSAIKSVGEVAIDGVRPSCTFLLDMEPAAALQRVGRQLDRVERRGSLYREQLRVGFLKEASLNPASVHIIRADRAIEDIQSEIRAIAERLL